MGGDLLHPHPVVTWAKTVGPAPRILRASRSITQAGVPVRDLPFRWDVTEGAHNAMHAVRVLVR